MEEHSVEEDAVGRRQKTQRIVVGEPRGDDHASRPGGHHDSGGSAIRRFATSTALVNFGVIGLTILIVAFALVIGRPEATPETTLSVGDVAEETFRAPGYKALPDEAATDEAREIARNNVRAITRNEPQVRNNVLSRLNSFFVDVRSAPLGPNAVASLETSVGAVDETNQVNTFNVEYTVAVQNLMTSLSSYDLVTEPLFAQAVTVLDASYSVDLGGDGTIDLEDIALPADEAIWPLAGGDVDSNDDDRPLAARGTDLFTVAVRFSVDPDEVAEGDADCSSRSAENPQAALAQRSTMTSQDTEFTDVACRNLPALTVVVPEPDTDEDGSTTTSATTTSTTTTLPPTTEIPTTTIPKEDQIAAIESEYLDFTPAVPTFVQLYEDHLGVVSAGEDGFFSEIEEEVIGVAESELDAGIRTDDLSTRKNDLLATPPQLFIAALTPEQSDDLDIAASIIVAQSLQANQVVDQVQWDAAKDAAAAAVEDQQRVYLPGEPIVEVGGTVDAVDLQAIQEFGLLDAEPGTSRVAAAVLGGLAVLLAALFLWRIAPARWSQPKHMGLLGVLLVIAAVVSRIPEVIAIENPELAFVIPAALVGYTAAIMYDPRTALLTAVPMAMFAAISTQDPGITVFAAAATITPIAFVSAVSTRRQLRLAVVLAAAVLAPVAGSVAWFFDGKDAVLAAAAAGFAGGLIGGFLGQGLVSFLENAFGMTTTVTLLDLTDRNHPALRLIEEKAPGTFNHSILVGNLAGKAARAIGADPLFAQAAAFYHDLGKTENPAFFIENQFGVSNPHDELDPAVSADIIRRHVTDGLQLAKRFRIPNEVAAGIQQHHGTGLMRFFYHRALEADPSIDPTLYRHHGVKPERSELAILMISDAVEGAARAMAQNEDPTAESLTKLVDAIVQEKLDDGQLDESALTFGDLSNVKRALVQALIGYYHTRVPYPGFPGPQVTGS